jgi:hypothetical protein
MWSYKIAPEGDDLDGILMPAVYIYCGNCATLHNLGDKAKNEKPAQRLTELPALNE